MPSYEISSDPARLDIDAIHAFLAQSYWATGIPREVVARAMANSLCFGVYCDGRQVGLARVITDKATFAYLSDVYVLPEHQGQGVAQRLLKEVMEHPDLQGLRRMLLFTRDAHSLYAKVGFNPLPNPERVMDLQWPDVYSVSKSSGQTWDAQQYSEQARFVSDLGMPVVELLAPKPGERVLDLGCGDGVLTAKLVALGCNVVAVDGSASMINAAKALGLDARVMDGHALDFDGEFDAVFSNAALHWMKQPERVVDGVWRALKPGGRFVGEMGGYGNVAIIVAALEAALRARGIDPQPFNPWYFPTAEQYAAILAARGFQVHSSELIDRPTPLPGKVIGWLETFAQPFASALPESERPALFQQVMESCRQQLCDRDGRWTADYVRLRFAATKPAA